MGDVIVIGTISLDGYAAAPGDDLSRLHRWMSSDEDGSADDPFFAIFRRAGAIVLGRRTYDVGQEPWGDDDVFESPVVVVTHEERASVTKNGTTFTFVSGSPAEILAAAREHAGDGDVLVMGSPCVAQQLLAAGLVDTLLLHQAPVLLGDGIPMFGALPGQVELVAELMEAGPEVSRMRFAVSRTESAAAGSRA